MRESGARPYATAPFGDIVLAPAFLPANLLLLASVLLLRRIDQTRSALVLIVLAPGFLFITFQNWGNDALWLVALGIALPATAQLAEMGRPARGGGDALTVAAGWLALALIAPVMVNLAVSPLRHFRLDRAQTAPLLGEAHPDFRATRSVADDIRVSLPGLDALDSDAELLACQLTNGYAAAMGRIAERLAEDPRVAGKAALVADSVSPLHLMGPFAPIRHGAVWYYGGTETLRAADFIVAPVCPTAPNVRAAMLEAIRDDPALSLTEIDRTDDYVLYALGR
ncbi:MAG: hypothetical protein D6811_11880 [Alphaproteobacteria bacterium]|nr:MAG: hypothetical protein D6811_11880 [Alphaproteobacteria bacterium]